MTPVLPDYTGASVCGLVPALVGGRDAPWIPHEVRDARSVVLLVLDGLGWAMLTDHDLPVMSAMAGGPITTVVPSTTSAALTSVTTGLPPVRHGLTGYRILVGGRVLNTLRWHSTDGRAPDPFDVQRHTAFLGRPVPVVAQAQFRGSGFSEAHMRGARFVGWRTTSALVEHSLRLVRRGERFVYAYYPGVDTVAHEFGLHDGFLARELRAADALVGEMLDALPEEAALLVTADHGQVHLDADSWLEIPALAPMIETQAGDARFRYLYARPGARTDLLDAAREEVGGVAWVRSRAEILEDGWLGRGGPGSIGERVGDVVLAARDPVAFVDPALPQEARLRSGHGSLTADEMLVPLLAARGRAG